MQINKEHIRKTKQSFFHKTLFHLQSFIKQCKMKVIISTFINASKITWNAFRKKKDTIK